MKRSLEILCFLGIQALNCKEANQVFSKAGAEIILKGILGEDMNYNFEDIQQTPYFGPDTIVEAEPVKVAEGVQIEES